jgi:hypothetical protein
MIRRLLPYAVLLGLTLLGYMYALATRDPVVRRAEIGLANWPDGAAPIRAVLISDIHVAGPDMPPARLAAIVAQINALRPDLVLIAGDLISEKRVATRYYSMADAIRPLGELTPRLAQWRCWAITIIGTMRPGLWLRCAARGWCCSTIRRSGWVRSRSAGWMTPIPAKTMFQPRSNSYDGWAAPSSS